MSLCRYIFSSIARPITSFQNLPSINILQDMYPVSEDLIHLLSAEYFVTTLAYPRES